MSYLTKSRSNILSRMPGRECVVIYDTDTPETIRAKVTKDIGYVIDMRMKNLISLDYILSKKESKNSEEQEEPQKKYNFY